MCRMIGVVFTGRFPIDILGDLRQVARDGRVPGEEKPGHRDGWGIVSYSDGVPRYIGRSARSMAEDPSFDSAVQDVAGIAGPNVLIAHARAASKGQATVENAHPFVVGRTVFAHNGTVYGLEPAKGMMAKGESDSEILAMIIAERYRHEGDIGSALISAVGEDMANHDFTGAVFLVSDGEKLLGYRDFKNPARESYYDLRLAKHDDSVVLFQETRSDYHGEVTQIGKGEMISIDKELNISRQQIL